MILPSHLAPEARPMTATTAGMPHTTKEYDRKIGEGAFTGQQKSPRHLQGCARVRECVRVRFSDEQTHAKCLNTFIFACTNMQTNSKSERDRVRETAEQSVPHALHPHSHPCRWSLVMQHAEPQPMHKYHAHSSQVHTFLCNFTICAARTKAEETQDKIGSSSSSRK